jgi:hypothetical protein
MTARLRKVVRTGDRDLRIDFVRGLALWFIFIDHAGNNPLERVTLGRFALCDAAEVFVLLSGISSGLAYGGAFDRYGWLQAARSALRRAGVIYVAYLGLFVAFAALVWALDAASGSLGSLIHSVQLDSLFLHPVAGPLEIASMRFTPYTMDVLPLYVALLSLLAGVLPLLRKPVLLLAMSTALYVTGRVFVLNLPTWDGNGWGFDPFEWQALFFIGAVVGYASLPVRRRTVTTPGWLLALCLGFLFLTRGAQLLQAKPDLAAHMTWLASVAHAVQPYFPSLDEKSWLHPLRFGAILALAVLFRAAVPLKARWLAGAPATPFVLMGQNSLAVFSASVLLSFLTRVVLDASPKFTTMVAVNLIGFALLVAAGCGAASLSGRRRKLTGPGGASGETTPALSASGLT